MVSTRSVYSLRTRISLGLLYIGLVVLGWPQKTMALSRPIISTRVGDIRPYQPSDGNLIDFENFYQSQQNSFKRTTAATESCHDAMLAKSGYRNKGGRFLHGEGKRILIDVKTPPTATISPDKITISPGTIQRATLDADSYRILLEPFVGPPGLYFEDHIHDRRSTGCVEPDGSACPVAGQHIVRLYQNKDGSEHYLRWVGISETGLLTAGPFLTRGQTKQFLATRQGFVLALLDRFFVIKAAPEGPVGGGGKPPKSQPPGVEDIDPEFRANQPPFPAEIQGAEVQALGGTGAYTMALDTSLGGKKPKVDLPPNSVDYHWSVYNITEIAKRGLAPDAVARWVVSPPAVEAEEISKTAGFRRDLARELGDLGEDVVGSIRRVGAGAKKIAEGDLSGFKDIGVEGFNLSTTTASGLKSLGGFAVFSATEMAGDASQDRNIPWTTEGIFLIRCVATPKEQQGNKPASSIAIKIIEVRSAQYLARNTLEAADAEIDRIRFELAEAQDGATTKQLQDQLQEAIVQSRGQAIDALTQGLRTVEKKKEALRSGDCRWRPIDLFVGWWGTGQRHTQRQRCALLGERLDKEKSRLQELLQLAQRRQQAFSVSGASVLHRPQIAFASQSSGLSYPLLVQLGRIQSTDGRIHWRLSDVTTPDGDIYEGSGFTDEQAVWDVLRVFARQNKYDRGYLAIRLPAGAPFAGMQHQSTLLRNAAGGGTLLRQRLQDLTIVLTSLSFFVPGVGQAAFVISAALAADRLYQKFTNGTLRVTADTVNDVVAVLSVANAGLQKLGKFKLIRAQRAFVLAGASGDAAALQTALQRIESASAFTSGTELLNEVINHGGMIVGNLQLLTELNGISQEEAEGTLTHAQARRLRYQHLLSGLQNNVLYIQGLKHGRKASELAESTAPRSIPELPSPEITAAHFRDGVRVLPPAEAAQIRRALMAEHPPALETTAGNGGMTEGTGATRGGAVYKVASATDPHRMAAHDPELHAALERVPLSLVEGSVLRAAPATTPPAGAPPEARRYTLEVPLEGAQRSQVRVSVEATPHRPHAASSPHGEEGGRAHFKLTRVHGAWEANIYVHERVFPQDVQHLLGHELNEVALLVKKLHNVPDASLREEIHREAQAGVFQSGGEATALTVHDHAAAHEFFRLFEEYTLVEQQRIQARERVKQLDADPAATPTQKADAGSAKGVWDVTYESHRARLNRMLKAMGVASVQEGKAQLLQPAGDINAAPRLEMLLQSSETLLQQTRPSANQPPAAHQKWQALRDGIRDQLRPLYATALAEQLRSVSPKGVEYGVADVAHVIYPLYDPGDFKKTGIHGGHSDAELMRLQQEHPQVSFEPIGLPKTIAGLTIRKYKQHHVHNGVAQSAPEALPKTTVDNVPLLLEYGLQAFDIWKNTSADIEGKKLLLDNIPWSAGLPNGLFLGGYAKYNPLQQQWTIKTVYPQDAQGGQGGQ